MVRGLDKFREHFAGFEDHYALIGGVACSIALEQAGLEFRVTKDIDIVICIEALNKEFGDAFWDFIQSGKYNNLQKSTGKHLFYRFYKPEDKSYPFMLELFARDPGILPLREGSHLTPIPIDDEVSSLSAIIMDDEYYKFIQKNKIVLDGISIIKEEHLIPLKARVWLDLTHRKNEGEKIDRNDIKKHKNDVFRLYQLLTPDSKIHLPSSIAEELKQFIDRVRSDSSINLKQLGLINTTPNEVFDNLETIYNLIL
ncbi:MAG: hypothetical protein P9X24_11345 [Candidatus Hatepunaea meridiana]|nr:hypothetical protein [Candidatus Hatepunaea meridiana]